MYYIQGVKNCIKAINIYKKRASYLQANKIFNTLIEYIYFMYEEYSNGLEYIEDVIIGIEKSNKEYYALAFIEIENLYACIPIPLLSPKASRYLLVHNHIVFTDKKEHNRAHSFAPYTDEELEIINSSEEFLGICLPASSNLVCERNNIEVSLLEEEVKDNPNRETISCLSKKIENINKEIQETETRDKERRIKRNTPKLLQEVLNFMDETGSGYDPGNDDEVETLSEQISSCRKYYSDIHNVEFFFVVSDLIKVIAVYSYDPEFCYLPDKLKVRGEEYKVEICHVRDF